MLIQNPPVEISSGLWMLGSAAYPVYFVNGGSQGAIVEGGISALAPTVLAQLKQLGVGPQFVGQLVLTHAHPDHVMAVSALRAALPEMKVVASQAACATLASEKAMAMFQQIDAALTGSLSARGLVAPAEQTSAAAAGPLHVDRMVQEGDTIQIGQTTWSVLATPGHSDCSISLHNQRDRLLIISDATGYYMPESGSWWPNYFTGYGAYVASIERLAVLDAEVACLSHNGAIRGKEEVRAYFQAALKATQAYHQRIVAEVKSGKETRQVAEELGNEIHAVSGVLPVEFFQKNCGILVKQSLRHEGVT